MTTFGVFFAPAMPAEEPEITSTNRNAVVSLVAALLTILALCLGAVPIPLTGFVCFPAAVGLGIVAIVAGVLSLQQIRASRQKGKEFAVAGIWIGAPGAAAALCMAALGILLGSQIVDLIRTVGH